jgi:tetratricopeptide (TPR) repeat protein
VHGFVLDAKSRQPVSGARVRIEERGVFAASGPTVASTDEAGRYTARALIGKTKKKIDWFRALTSLPVVVSFPVLAVFEPQSVQKQSHMVLATRLNVSVEKEGYQPFVGEVSCERLDAGKFAVDLDDVWLAPAGSNLTSFSPDHVRNVRVDSFSVEPAVAHPGDSVTVTARIRIPYERGGRYRVYLDSSAPRLVQTDVALTLVSKPDPATGLSTFRRVVTLPRSPKVWTTELSPWVSLDYHEIPLDWDSKALLQVVLSDTSRPAAQQVQDGYNHLVQHDVSLALDSLRCATQSDPKYAPAYLYLGEAYAQAGRTEEAANAYGQLVTLAPENLDAYPRYADALLDEGNTDKASQVLEAAGKKTKRVTGPIALAKARMFAQRGDLHAADEQLAQAGQNGRIPRPVQQEMALQRARAALRATPDNPDAELALARALADLNRLEEAVQHARRAQTLRPNEPWPLIELAGLERRLGHTEVATVALQRALTIDPRNADAHLSLGEVLLDSNQYAAAREQFQAAVERRPYEFTAHHGLALAELGAATRGPDWPPASALKSLRTAAVIGLGKGEMDPGFELPMGLFTSLYFGPKKVTIAGFERRQGADDYQLAQSLEALKRRPDDALALFDAGTALIRLSQPDLGLEFLNHAAALRPELADLQYWRGLAFIELRRPEEARQALEATLKLNPLHRHANGVLARLCLNDGEMEQAQAHLAAQRQNWPNEIVRDEDEPEAQP